jgi:hypothetical protein
LPRSNKEWGYIGRKFFGAKMWAPTAAGPIIAEHLKSLTEFPPRQIADTLSLKKALEGIMQKMENPKGNTTRFGWRGDLNQLFLPLAAKAAWRRGPVVVTET